MSRIFDDLRRRYGRDYNRGRPMFEDVDGGGYKGAGHWRNTMRWVLSAAGILQALREIYPPRYLETYGILEVGCGAGALTRELNLMGVSTHGLDIGNDFSEGFPYLQRFVQGNAATLPFRASSFSTIVALDVVEHVPLDYQRELFADFARVALDCVLLTVPVAQPGEPERFFPSSVGPRHHYLTLSLPHWVDHFLECGWRPFDLSSGVATMAERLRMCGAPFNHGDDNYPFLLVPRW